MPIYEFYCKECHCIYSFFSKTVNTEKIPVCPKCDTGKPLSRQVSMFAIAGRASENNEDADLPIDESKMEKAMALLEKEAGNINEDDPRQAANLMRKLSDMTGLELGNGMNEALRRMENGEDPDQIEADIGSMLESEEPFIFPDGKSKKGPAKKQAPRKDETLYDL
jgi:putative FmdB family regulatory protein